VPSSSSASASDSPSTARSGSRRPRPALLAGLLGAVAIASGGLLALAPVDTADVRVAWPQDAADIRSTSLLLTNQTPHVLDASFTSRAVEAAAATDDGVLLATIDPAEPEAADDGLVLTASGTALTLRIGGATERIPLDAGADVSYALHSDVQGLTLDADGSRVIDLPGTLPPQVDALVSSVASVPTPSDLAVGVQVVDDFDSTPSGIKIAVMVLMWLSLIGALVVLARDDRRRREARAHDAAAASDAPDPAARPAAVPAGGSSDGPPAGSPARRGIASRVLRALRPVDALVVAVLVLWIFIGPMTDDDGYYAAMSLNDGVAGFVGNYYQMFNQSFTPFTWFWQLLGAWQELGGRSPVWLRTPALIAGIAAWFVTRRLLERAAVRLSRRGLLWARGLLAATFLIWWLSYTIGSRPEILGSLAGVVVVALVLRSRDRGTLLPAAIAALVAGLAFAAHPTGIVAFAPLLLGIPGFWRLAYQGGSRLAAAARTMAVLSVGSVALFAAFADATLSDALTGPKRFAAVETPLTWLNEWSRYALLMNDIPMGSYAKRSVVLLALVLLVWWVATYAASRMSPRAAQLVPAPLELAGWGLALSFVLLWITPSKWTHHFGAISSVGPLFVTLFLVLAPGIVTGLLQGRRAPWWLTPLAVASLIPVIVFSLHGPNSWAYAWGQGMFGDGRVPGFGPVRFGELPIWILVAAAVVAVGVLVQRRAGRAWSEPRSLWSVTALATVFALVTGGYLVGTFSLAAARGLDGFSVGAANIEDPAGSQCLTGAAITTWDASAGRPLAVDEGDEADAASPGSFALDAGWPASDPPPALADGIAVWGSYAEGGDTVGRMTTPWYRVPETTDRQRIAVLIGGELAADDADRLRLQIRAADGTVVDLGGVAVEDTVDRPGWRTIALDPSRLTPGDTIRLQAEDGTTGESGWFGFTAPVLVDPVSFNDLSAPDAPTAVTWTSSFWFPCQRPVSIAHGIIERPVLATTFGDGGPDNIWVQSRGGSLAGVERSATVNTLASDMEGAGSSWGRVQLFDYPYAADAYDLTVDRVSTWGWRTPFEPVSQIVEFDRLPDSGH
jgi:arabinosyltransferase C